MDAVIFNFEKLKQEYNQRIYIQKKELILECQQQIMQDEEKIRILATQIEDLQTNINLNYRLLSKINKQ